MPKRKKSILNILGWGVLGDVFLLTVAIAITGIFAVSSLSVAYTIAFVVLILFLISLHVFNRVRRKKHD